MPAAGLGEPMEPPDWFEEEHLHATRALLAEARSRRVDAIDLVLAEPLAPRALPGRWRRAALSVELAEAVWDELRWIAEAPVGDPADSYARMTRIGFLGKPWAAYASWRRNPDAWMAGHDARDRVVATVEACGRSVSPLHANPEGSLSFLVYPPDRPLAPGEERPEPVELRHRGGVWEVAVPKDGERARHDEAPLCFADLDDAIEAAVREAV